MALYTLYQIFHTPRCTCTSCTKCMSLVGCCFLNRLNKFLHEPCSFKFDLELFVVNIFIIIIIQLLVNYNWGYFIFKMTSGYMLILESGCSPTLATCRLLPFLHSFLTFQISIVLLLLIFLPSIAVSAVSY